jgi:hypothetical protein
MGSGAFIVAACRYLAAAYEAALVAGGDAGHDDISDADRAGFRRTVAQRCLYGVDINPMAVQLGRLSLWLATLAADRPLTFLDHRLRPGNSLVGAWRENLSRQPSGSRRRSSQWSAPLPLFDDEPTAAGVRFTIAAREAIANEPGDTIAAVRAKERSLARLTAPDAPLARLKDASDAWCAWWFRERGQRGAPAFAPSSIRWPGEACFQTMSLRPCSRPCGRPRSRAASSTGSSSFPRRSARAASRRNARASMRS